MSAHATQALAYGVDVALLAGAIAIFALRRSHLAAVTLLLAAAPLWSVAAALVHLSDLGQTPVEEAALAIAAHLPLWAAFVVGLFRLLGSTPPPTTRAMKGVSE